MGVGVAYIALSIVRELKVYNCCGVVSHGVSIKKGPSGPFFIMT